MLVVGVVDSDVGVIVAAVAVALAEEVNGMMKKSGTLASPSPNRPL